MTETHDVIVVGARCAGSATAMLLARQGLDVLVLDRAGYGSDTVSTHALMRGGVLQLQRWGVLDRIVAAGTPPVRRALFHYPGEATARITIRPAAGVDALYAPRRTVLDPALADAAAEAGADLRFGTGVTGVLRDDSGRVTGVVAQDRDGRRLEAIAPLTIGADGMRSTVASAVGAPVLRRARGAGGAFLYGHWDELPVDGYEWVYAPYASAGMIPTNDGRTTVFVGTTPDRMKEARATAPADRVVDDLLRSASPSVADRVADARRPVRLRGFAGEPGFLRQVWGPGWALVGDAGGFEDPLSTHGMTDALRDAELLARAVRQIHAGSLPELAALAAYQQSRDRMAGRLFGVVDAIGSYAWTMDGLRPLLREAASAMSEQVEELERLDPLPVVTGR
ncbi:NAD(P)/FAD-dependent oxidoreductase [Isoptericola croceus]|uniref:NAD(P)/FAD-dependent oxidoreductase n=1 Tax=Isoptericola croceus TaxID=3031406 RepID=UPI0023F63A27|nr:NAD(P)/FAD-dependent oxidoreductase [Isoptericola croceus]